MRFAFLAVFVAILSLSACQNGSGKGANGGNFLIGMCIKEAEIQSCQPEKIIDQFGDTYLEGRTSNNIYSVQRFSDSAIVIPMVHLHQNAISENIEHSMCNDWNDEMHSCRFIQRAFVMTLTVPVAYSVGDDGVVHVSVNPSGRCTNHEDYRKDGDSLFKMPKPNTGECTSVQQAANQIELQNSSGWTRQEYISEDF